MKHDAGDLVIVGGGIIGTAIAYYAAKSGMKVVLAERGEIAGGTSSRCDGNILAIDKEPGFDSRMSLLSQKLVAEMAKELEDEFEYRAPGSILVCENDQEMQAAELWVTRQQQEGLPFRMLDQQDLREEWPYLAKDLPGGLECKTDSTVNPVQMTYALARAARRMGARLLPRMPIQSILKDERGNACGVETPNGVIHADAVVLAAGVWTRSIGHSLGLDLPIIPRKGHILVSARMPSIGNRKVMEFGYLMSKFGGQRSVDEVYEKYGVALVFEPTASQNILIGSSRQFVGMDTGVDQQVIRLIARRAIRFFPALANVPLMRAYTGLRPWTPDHLPIISAVDEVPGLFIASGHEGDGISLAAVTGKLVTEMVRGEPTCIPVEPLRYDRFGEAFTSHDIHGEVTG
ncbi:sarcosine oxidase subunit beta [Paenibacillus jamilae]|jgi:glycine/D-amino acid oxidase-like deaminating enzyme|uniref:NAD(P)/FAD-dependent oxidoreductase n=1 Tax=Paenibacillus TaxID=44249 RepID=UPI000D2FC12F|nr:MULTISPECIES: FAD-binding oxidoreductase [Paenibacillus]MDP9675925.1 sarcosine oxidase subunit beta [Paenibacillus jamilae]KAF6618525.1 FAD-binding oxidoreductase [Paenibacillus sp. EKM101P]KAF6624871.1 FAD-binding oxidoreductase [Paenibacillus sp. EKM102P]KAF6635351.1 FAD-binding oxidoreductase [Paenibacillus sp. EKM10P]KAF6648941.1 FAD-binding oxidoreductase [Paenibacillus sp. EKM11P]